MNVSEVSVAGGTGNGILQIRFMRPNITIDNQFDAGIHNLAKSCLSFDSQEKLHNAGRDGLFNTTNVNCGYTETNITVCGAFKLCAICSILTVYTALQYFVGQCTWQADGRKYKMYYADLLRGRVPSERQDNKRIYDTDSISANVFNFLYAKKVIVNFNDVLHHVGGTKHPLQVREIGIYTQ